MRQREPRQRNEAFLAFIRAKACCICGKPGPSDPAHIRSANPALEKPHTGMAEKPSDCWCTPLCRVCHDAQHKVSELVFWVQYRKNPFHIAMAYYAMFIAQGGAETTPRQKVRKIKPRKPKHMRQKIQSRKFGT